jgi:hypothetical protein
MLAVVQDQQQTTAAQRVGEPLRGTDPARLRIVPDAERRQHGLGHVGGARRELDQAGAVLRGPGTGAGCKISW